ncbi:MAG TPA: NUDIX hydrolase [Acidimicrobiales bacterium]|nr:NUDIX hydrolase [Acidimicrobiales bacterium]
MSAPELAVGAVVVHSGSLLLVRRGLPPAAGMWSVPGGRVEPGETLDEAVVREVREETSLDVEAGELLGWVERRAGGHHYVIVDFRAALHPGAGEPAPRPGDDAAEARLVPLDEVERLGLVPGLGAFLRDHGVL